MKMYNYKKEIPLKRASQLFQRGFRVLPGAGMKNDLLQGLAFVITIPGPNQNRDSATNSKGPESSARRHIFGTSTPIYCNVFLARTVWFLESQIVKG